MECPDCFTIVPVPALDAAAARQPPVKEREDVDTYSLGAAPEESHRVKPAETVTAELACPACGTKANVLLEDRPRLTTCESCLEVIPVPSQADLRARKTPEQKHATKRPKKRKKPRPKSQQQPVVAPDETEAPPTHANPFETESAIRDEPPPPIPTWTFFTRVFTLPWHREVFSRWAYSSLGWAFIGLLVGGVHWLIANGFVIGLPFMALPVVLFVLWTGSFAVSSAVTILEDTAAGNDVIHHWNDGGWGDWLGDSYGPVFLSTSAWFGGFLIGKLVATTGHPALYWPALLAGFCVLLPIVVLSALEAGSWFIPLSGPVLKSLVRLPGQWLAYYAVSGAIAAVYFSIVLLGLSRGFWFTTLILTGPLLGTVIFIEARLLGRLGWKTIVLESRKRKRSKGKSRRSGEKSRKKSPVKSGGRSESH